jgi:hypothetical protein
MVINEDDFIVSRSPPLALPPSRMLKVELDSVASYTHASSSDRSSLALLPDELVRESAAVSSKSYAPGPRSSCLVHCARAGQ